MPFGFSLTCERLGVGLFRRSRTFAHGWSALCSSLGVFLSFFGLFSVFKELYVILVFMATPGYTMSKESSFSGHS
jgi:hypothetical protein